MTGVITRFGGDPLHPERQKTVSVLSLLSFAIPSKCRFLHGQPLGVAFGVSGPIIG